ARALVTALSTAEAETVILQWLLGPRRGPTVIGADRDTRGNHDERRARQTKVAEAGFRAIGRVGVAASSDARARMLAGRVLAAIRQAESPGVSVEFRPGRADDVATAAPRRRWPLALNVRELTPLTAWPLGDSLYPGVRDGGAVPLRALPTSSTTRILGTSTYPGDERRLVLSARDALQHLHVMGPTGVGKSTLLTNLIIDDIMNNRGVVVIDPKGDLIEDVLGRVPDDRRDDVVVLDPADAMRPVGLNALQGGDRSPELIADQVLAVFHGLYRDNWGPRTQDILHASLLTLAGRPGMTLCALPVLLSNERFRSRVVREVEDRIALRPFWHWYDTLSEGERQQAIAPVMNKLRAFLLRPRM
ncbi:MAG: type IV secretory system conjugative DNA transfer family protein, partial [Sphingopyxis sp.]